MKSRIKIFKIDKNLSESRNILSQVSRKTLEFKDFKISEPPSYLFKVNNINTRKRCEICSKLIMKKPERRQ